MLLGKPPFKSFAFRAKGETYRLPGIKMPAKGKYFLNENEGCKLTDPLYEKYLYASQQHPLLFFLLFIVVAYCSTLIVVLLSYDVSNVLLFLVFRF